MVKYCSRECQIAHRPQHKKECKKRAAELHDEALFKQPPQLEDCPICFLPMPTLFSGRRYQACCGKEICCGCIHAVYMIDDEEKCPFCRTPAPTTDEELVKRLEHRVDKNNEPEAIHNLTFFQCSSSHDIEKALILWHRAGELGYANSYNSMRLAYMHGEGVGVNKKKAQHYFELAAMLGSTSSRYNLGALEEYAGNLDRALKHWMISAAFGYSDSLEVIKELFMDGHATKDDYTKALRAHQAYVNGIRSAQRDEAAAFDDDNKYY